MQEKKDGRIVIKGAAARDRLLEGAEAVYEAVTTTFGPRGRNVLAEKPFGRPVLTRDGVTVARETYFSDRAKNVGAQLLLEASETTNRIAGDGTTATAAFGYQLMREGAQAIAAGMHPMVVRDAITADADLMLDELTKIKKDIKKGQLVQVATVSSGDPLLGQLIAEAVEYVGPDGGIIAEKSPVDNVEREYVDGYYLQSGFQALQAGRKELHDPWVIVSSRRLTSPFDIGEIMEQTAQMNMKPGQAPRFLFIGNIEEAAYNYVVAMINQGKIDAVVIKTPPQFGEMGKDLLHDIAILAGCEPITDSTNVKQFDNTYVGRINRVVASKIEATIFADNSGETVQDRIAAIQSQIDTEVVDGIVEKLRDRKAKLEGKVALFRIGGATETEKEEREFRVEDAILATKAAYAHGVVPGGATTLLHLSKLSGLSDITRVALRNVFTQLLSNANLPTELKLHEALEAKLGWGFNLRESDELVDLVAAGVLDPKLVAEQIVRNATSVAANALTTDVLLIFENKDEAPQS